MIHSQHKSIFGITRGRWGQKQRFFSQLLNNLQTLPVYSLRLYSWQTTSVKGKESAVKWEGEKEVDRLFGKTAVKSAKGQSKGGVKYMRRKRKRREKTGISRDIQGKKISVSVMIKRLEGEGANSSHSDSSFCLLWTLDVSTGWGSLVKSNWSHIWGAARSLN